MWLWSVAFLKVGTLAPKTPLPLMICRIGLVLVIEKCSSRAYWAVLSGVGSSPHFLAEAAESSYREVWPTLRKLFN